MKRAVNTYMPLKKYTFWTFQRRFGRFIISSSCRQKAHCGHTVRFWVICKKFLDDVDSGVVQIIHYKLKMFLQLFSTFWNFILYHNSIFFLQLWFSWACQIMFFMEKELKGCTKKKERFNFCKCRVVERWGAKHPTFSEHSIWNSNPYKSFFFCDCHQNRLHQEISGKILKIWRRAFNVGKKMTYWNVRNGIGNFRRSAFWRVGKKGKRERETRERELQ